MKLRSIGAVFAGLVAIFALSLGTDTVMHALGALPPLGAPMGHGHALLATLHRIVYGVVGGCVAARLAPDRPARHALALGAVGVVISTAGALATWGRGPEFGPNWYPLAIVAISLPCAWLGGRLRELQLRPREAR